MEYIWARIEKRLGWLAKLRWLPRVPALLVLGAWLVVKLLGLGRTLLVLAAGGIGYALGSRQGGDEEE